MPPLTRLRHYGNLDQTEGRLRRLLKDFRFSTVAHVVQSGGFPDGRFCPSVPGLHAGSLGMSAPHRAAGGAHARAPRANGCLRPGLGRLRRQPARRVRLPPGGVGWRDRARVRAPDAVSGRVRRGRHCRHSPAGAVQHAALRPIRDLDAVRELRRHSWPTRARRPRRCWPRPFTRRKSPGARISSFGTRGGCSRTCRFRRTRSRWSFRSSGPSTSSGACSIASCAIRSGKPRSPG